MSEQSTVDVVVARNIKRYGKEVRQGTRLQIPREELERAPAGIYILPGQAVDPEQRQRQERERQLTADRAEKVRRIEADRSRREDEARRLMEWHHQQEQLARAGAARVQQERGRSPNAGPDAFIAEGVGGAGGPGPAAAAAPAPSGLASGAPSTRGRLRSGA